MREFTATVIDTAGIQNYIFGSNSLKHNVGASGLVHCATNDWVYRGLIGLGATNVKVIDQRWDLDDSVTIENDDLDSEVVYAGGGNTVILFKTNDLAKEFTKHLTRRVLLKASGLQLVIRHTDFDWDGKRHIKEIISNTIREVNTKKFDRLYSTPLLGLGVTADCQYTGLPAVMTRREYENDPTSEVRISNEVVAKWNFFKKADERLNEMFPLEDGFKYIYRFDDFGTKHEASYIAVVHIDGNGMGARFRGIDNEPTKDNREYIMAIRELSRSVEDVSTKALQVSITKLQESIDRDNNKIGNIIKIRDGKFPFRPIVFGGDDVTFVCDGRLGLTLTEFFLSELTSHALSDGEPIYARAGIAIVKSHYPFSRAVALSESLAKSAKEYIKTRGKPPYDEENLSAIDWHFASTGPVDDLAAIREREYAPSSGRLYMRPVRLGESVRTDWHSWATFCKIMSAFKGKEWSDKRNKLMSLRETLRAGPDAVRQFITAYKIPLPKITGDPESAETGWSTSGECTCFDAIEAIDFFIQLDGGGK